MRKITFVVKESDNNKTVMKFLVNNNVSKRLITKLKRTPNGITRNNQHVRTIDKISVGDKIQLVLDDEKQLEKNSFLNVPVLYEDEDVIVFDKPPKMPVHPSHGHLLDTLGNYYSSCCNGLSFRPINRLDRDTSGIVVVAKNSFSATFIQSNMKKTYYAICLGTLKNDDTINKAIARENDSIIKRCVRDDGQQAITHYKVLSNNDKYTYLKINLETGRTHQIRVHFSYIGHPLAGDTMYGGDCEDISRQALHCKETEFVHPITKEKICISSKLPDDMQSLLR